MDFKYLIIIDAVCDPTFMFIYFSTAELGTLRNVFLKVSLYIAYRIIEVFFILPFLLSSLDQLQLVLSSLMTAADHTRAAIGRHMCKAHTH